MARISQLQGSTLPLGKITVGKQLGVGGFGVVHAATLSGVNVPFAIKFLDPSPFNSDAVAARERFFKEAEILFRLRHPHIIAIYGVGEHEGRAYILMERSRGMNLHQARNFATPDPEKVLPFIENIAGALGYAHANGVVHRDIKPTNLMAGATEGGRVLDFGVATALDPEGTRLTKTGGGVCRRRLLRSRTCREPKTS